MLTSRLYIDITPSKFQILKNIELCYICWWLVWRRGNVVRHINKVKLRRARLVQGLVTTFGGSTIPIFIQATAGPLSLAIPPWVVATSAGDGFGNLLEETAPLHEVTTLRRFINQFIIYNISL